MAQLKDSLVQGSMRVTDTLYANALNGSTLTLPTTALNTPSLKWANSNTDYSRIITTPNGVLNLLSKRQIRLCPGNEIGSTTPADNFQAVQGVSVHTDAFVPIVGGTMSLGSPDDQWLDVYATAVHNAVWNDYAEYRAAASYIEPGRVVVDTDNGEVILAAQRLQPGAQVVSDTWGHIMGETEQAKTPIAVAGRVLVYPYRDRSEYHAGMTVCSAPNGTVDIMTRDEIRDYPDCIIGIVSEIPNYEEWGTSNVKVDGRIWVRVR